VLTKIFGSLKINITTPSKCVVALKGHLVYNTNLLSETFALFASTSCLQRNLIRIVRALESK